MSKSARFRDTSIDESDVGEIKTYIRDWEVRDVVDLCEKISEDAQAGGLVAEEIAELSRGNAITAIKLVRERTQLSLKDAKAIVDKHREQE